MLPKCDVASPEGCDEQEKAYIEKMKAKGSEIAKAELARLEGTAERVTGQSLRRHEGLGDEARKETVAVQAHPHTQAVLIQR